MVYKGAVHLVFLFFFNDTATTEIYTLSLHDALPIFSVCPSGADLATISAPMLPLAPGLFSMTMGCPRRSESFRSEEHTSELQSHSDLVCRLLLEKKKKINACIRQSS